MHVCCILRATQVKVFCRPTDPPSHGAIVGVRSGPYAPRTTHTHTASVRCSVHVAAAFFAMMLFTIRTDPPNA